MRPLARFTAVAVTAVLTGLFAPSVGAADADGEITVAAAVDGHTVTVTVTDTYTGDVDEKGCKGIFLGAPPYTDDNPPLDYAVLTTTGGVYTHDFTDVPDGQWRVDYWCRAVKDGTGMVDYWVTSDSDHPPMVKNREPIRLTVPAAEPEPEPAPEPPAEPGCFGSVCLFTGSS